MCKLKVTWLWAGWPMNCGSVPGGGLLQRIHTGCGCTLPLVLSDQVWSGQGTKLVTQLIHCGGYKWVELCHHSPIYISCVLKDNIYLIEKFWLPEGTRIYFIKLVYVTCLKNGIFLMVWTVAVPLCCISPSHVSLLQFSCPFLSHFHYASHIFDCWFIKVSVELLPLIPCLRIFFATRWCYVWHQTCFLCHGYHTTYSLLLPSA